jgi:diguanylate cyclase (GGDEF)-like protein
MDKVLQAIAESARQVLDVTRCAIYLRDEQTGTITGIYSRGLSERYVDAVKRSYEDSAGGVLGRSREPMIISDGQTDARLEPLRDLVVSEGIHTMCLLPLLYHDDIVGALSFYHDRIRPYSPDDMLLAKAIANGAAIAIKNSILLSQTQRRAAEAALLNQVMAVITETLDFKEIAWRVVEALAKNFGYSRVSISEREGDTLTVLAQVGYSHLWVPMPINAGICGRVVRSGKSALVADVTQDSDYVGLEPDVKSLIVVPIYREEQVVAVLRVDSTESRLLMGADLDLLVSVAQQLTAALRNAVLYEQARQAQEELRALYEAAKSISSSLELQAVLDNLVRVTCQAFGYELGAILLVDERSGDLVVAANYGYSGLVRGKRIPSGKGITGAVQQTGKPALIPDVREDSRYVGFSEEAASEIAVPLIIEGRVIGVFNVESPRYQAFGEHDLKILTTLAGYATIAIANARLYEQTKRLAITDGLTELYNHRYLNDAMARALERAIRDSQPLSVVMLEIDNFKHFNDTFGHQRGDEVLRIVADLIRKTSRSADFAARYGGDEFLIVLPNTGKGAAQDIAERIRRAVESYPFILGGSVVTSVTLSVGVAASPEDGVTVDAIVEAVDRAQYTAKRTGGNKVHSTRPLAQKA